MAEKTVTTIKLDVTPLPPPRPLEEILKHLDSLQAGQVLEVSNDMPFIHLLPRLAEMGFEYKLEQLAERSYLLRIWRRG
jgi:uncharacterized protein (DUF2249 family)